MLKLSRFGVSSPSNNVCLLKSSIELVTMSRICINKPDYFYCELTLAVQKPFLTPMLKISTIFVGWFQCGRSR